jgi:hypothetical protein
MDLQQKHDLSLIDLTNYCNDLGYKLGPLKSGGFVKGVLFLNGVWKKDGEKLYKEWIDCQKETYAKIYDALNKQ